MMVSVTRTPPASKIPTTAMKTKQRQCMIYSRLETNFLGQAYRTKFLLQQNNFPGKVFIIIMSS